MYMYKLGLASNNLQGLSENILIKLISQRNIISFLTFNKIYMRKYSVNYKRKVKRRTVVESNPKASLH